MTALAVLLAILALCLIVYVAIAINRILTPTTGRQIDRSSRPNTALIVVDVQTDFTRRTGKHAYEPQDVEAKIQRINEEAALAELRGSLVVSIRQVLKEPVAKAAVRIIAGPAGLAGSPGLGLDDRLDISADADFEKSRGDAFSSRPFEDWLDSNRVGTLRIVGLDGCYCVQSTSRGAINRGYGVTIVDDCVLTAFPERWGAIKADLEKSGAVIDGG